MFNNMCVSWWSVSSGWMTPSWISWGGKASATSVLSSATTTFTSSPGTSSTSSRRCQPSAAWPGTSASNSTTRPKTRMPQRSNSSPKISAPHQAESLFPPLPDQTPPSPLVHDASRTASTAGWPKPRSPSSRGRPRRRRSLSRPLLSPPNPLTSPTFIPPRSTLAARPRRIPRCQRLTATPRRSPNDPSQPFFLPAIAGSI